MSSYGAATTGVNPKTGSYLSSKERVAIFKGATGRSGYGGRSGGGDGTTGNKTNVAPQNAIVVANKMAAVVQTLQTNTQETVQAVNVRVEKNAKSIEDLYRSVQQSREAEAKREKTETKLLGAAKEDEQRKSKEGLIEGLSSIASGVVGAAKKGIDGILDPIKSFWEKLQTALLMLGGAFVIKNLPTIIEGVEDFTEWLSGFEDLIPNALTDIRGAWSIIDNILVKIWKGFGGLVDKTFQAAKWVGSKLVDTAKRIYTAIKEPISDVFTKVTTWTAKNFQTLWKKLTEGMVDLAKNAKNAASKALKGITEGVTSRLPGAGGTGGASGGGSKGIVGKTWSSITDFGGSVVNQGKQFLDQGKDFLSKGTKSISNQLGELQQSMTGIKPQSAAKRMGWFDDAIKPLIKAFPDMQPALAGLTKLTRGALKAIPGIGFAIDLALNKGVSGQGWTESIIRALGSSIAGGLSAAAGAQVGAGIGGSIGALAGGVGAIPGAAVGAALGAIIAGIAGGYVGDQAGAFAYEGITGETRTENKSDTNTLDLEGGGAHETIPASSVGSQPPASTNGMVSSATNGSSTPSGMTEPEGGNRSTVESIQMPPQTIDARTNKGDGETQIPGVVEDIPFYQTSDPAADVYRSYSKKEYGLVY